MRKSSLALSAMLLISIAVIVSAGLGMIGNIVSVRANPDPEVCDYVDNDEDGLCFGGSNPGIVCTQPSDCLDGGSCIMIDEDFVIDGIRPGVWGCYGENGTCSNYQGEVECLDLQTSICSTDPGGMDDKSSPEICDYLDNDCNGVIDNGFWIQGFRPGVWGCYGQYGICVNYQGEVECLDPQTSICSTDPGGIDDKSSEEVCDYEDNDCDGTADDPPLVPEACENQLGVCQDSNKSVCLEGVWQACSVDEYNFTGLYEVVEQTCDNLDNDCNGLIDEDLIQACGSGACAGTQICSVGTWNDCSTRNSDCGICCKCEDNNNPTETYDASQDNDCGLCQECSGLFTCSNQLAESDVKEECPADECKYGYCDGSGACSMKPDTTDCGVCALCDGLGSCNVFDATQDADCDDGLYCNGEETCQAIFTCQAGFPVDCSYLDDQCNNGVCNEVEDMCEASPKPDGTLCGDGLFCNVGETCQSGNCTGGTAKDCSDGVSCTDDSCNETTDSCDNIVNDSNCDNGLWCDGTEHCDALLDCQSGTAPDCDDVIGCTDDSCNETTDSCDNIANDSNCDDGLWCNGFETCDALLDCQDGTLIDCSGNNLAPIGQCDYIPDNILFTWDFFAGFTSICDEVNDVCTTGTAELTHTCNMTQCLAECEVDENCMDSTCEVTYDDYCDNGKLVEYDNDRVLDSTVVSNSTPNQCLEECTCTDNPVSCDPPDTNTYCAAGVCGAECEIDDDCPATDCGVFGGYYGAFYRYYHDVENMCADCMCTVNQCDNYTVYINLSLNNSWNLVSFPLELENDSIESVLGPIMEHVIVVNSFDGGAKTYDPEMPGFSDLQKIDYLHGYWIKVNESTNLTVNGTIPANKTINLSQGWNLISYLCDSPRDVEDVFAGIMDKVIVINGFENGAKTYDPELPMFSDLKVMKPNLGYWVKMDNDAVLNYTEMC